MRQPALIFDVDGTLAETEELHREAFNAAFHAAGMAWHWDRARYGQLLTTTGGKERLARHRDECGEIWMADATLAELHRAKTALYTRMMARGALTPRPGVNRLMTQARARGFRLAIATTTSPQNVEALSLALWNRPALQVFDVIAAGDEVAAKKPAPDIYHLALTRLGLPAAEAVAIEDSQNGLAAAQTAGLRCIVCPSLYTAADDFRGATARYSSLEEVDLDRLMAGAGA